MKQCSKNIIKVPKIVQLVCSRSETEFKYFNISLYENKIGQKEKKKNNRNLFFHSLRSQNFKIKLLEEP